MVNNQINDEFDIGLIIKHFYKNRRYIFRVLILSIVLSIVFSVARFLLNTPVYTYTSQSVIDITVEEDATYQKSMFISFLSSQIVFDESAKSINLDTSYAIWRDSIVIENIVGTNQVVYKISSANSEKLVELNRRIVSNAIFQSSKVLTGINVQTLEEAKLLEDVQEKRVNIDFFSQLLILTMLGLMSIFGWLSLQVLTDRRIKRPKDIQNHTGVAVIGTIPDFDGFSLSEEINLKNFMKGLIWENEKVVFETRNIDNPWVKESIRSLRNNLVIQEQEHKVICVSSLFPKEGVTTIVHLLALYLSEISKNVIVVSANLKQKDSDIDSKNFTLKDYLRGDCTLESIVLTVNEHFKMIPGSYADEDHSDLLYLEPYSSLISQLKSEYDFVLIDAPNFSMASESTILSRLSDALILVVKENNVNVDDFAEFSLRLQKQEINVIGVVLSGITDADYLEIKLV